ncbi:hypothetical protein ACLOJK_022470 [Asimina triloba]
MYRESSKASFAHAGVMKQLDFLLLGVMDEKNDLEKWDAVMMPGFRFHPTDEELVGYYLKRKIQQKSLPIELIKQVDIYKYNPWDLPKLVANGEKEWYFYCPRDQKYRNSTRPNRVTGAGFWKATGTDRPIYSSEGTKCIGLKKSLVFYKGRAARGIKTDWMMHEFRLPPISDSPQTKRPGDKNFPANDSWAICRIFKKTSSMAQRAPSHSWVSPLPENTSFHLYSQAEHATQVTSRDNTSCASQAGSKIQFSHSNEAQPFFETNFPPLDAPSYKHSNTTICKEPSLPISNMEFSTSMLFSPFGIGEQTKDTTEVSSVLQNLTPGIFWDINRASANIDFTAGHYKSDTINTQQETKGNGENAQEECSRKNTNSYCENIHWETTEEVGFPNNLHLNLSDELKANLSWDSPPCPSEMSLSYSPTECYTL